MVETLPIVMHYVRQYAEHIDGQFTEYDHVKSVIVVPLIDSRFQTVLATLKTSPVSNKPQAIFTSKVCTLHEGLDLNALLERNASFDYSKFIIEDGYLKVVASCLADTVTEAQVREMIQEVAQLADHYEMKLTGRDIH